MNIQAVKLGLIKEGNNPRTDFSKVPEIAESIKKVGQLQPIIIRQAGEKKGEPSFVLLDGACRYRAMKSIKMDEAQAIIWPINQEYSEEVVLAANLMRSDLNILERARGFGDLKASYPERYNKTTLAKSFGVTPKVAQDMLKVASKLPKEADAILGPSIGELGVSDLVTICQIPSDALPLFIKCWKNKEAYDDIDDVCCEAFHQLDYASDALTTGKLIAEGRAFSIKFGKRESAYTTDKVLYQKLKKEYEAKQKSKYGQTESSSRKLSDKEKEKQKKERAAERKARAEAIKSVPDLLKVFLSCKPNAKQLESLGKYLCGQKLNADMCRRLANMFDVKLPDSSYTIREDIWKHLFSKMCKTPETLIMLFAFVEIHAFKEQDWARELKKALK